MRDFSALGFHKICVRNMLDNGNFGAFSRGFT